MKKKTCFIVGAGDFDGMSVWPDADDLIIAADGGYNYLNKLGIEPHVLMGDFDSLELLPEHRHILRHSPIKDDTDMALAVAYAAELGYQRFLIYGGLGGRLDHTMANLQLLNGMSRQGLEAYLIGEKTIITAVTKERIIFSKECSGIISVFCMGEAAKGVWERGLKYELSDAEMTCDRTLGVSNEFIGCESWIEVKENTLQIVWEEANGLPKQRLRKEYTERTLEAMLSCSGWNAMHAQEAGEIESETYAGGKQNEK